LHARGERRRNGCRQARLERHRYQVVTPGAVATAAPQRAHDGGDANVAHPGGRGRGRARVACAVYTRDPAWRRAPGRPSPEQAMNDLEQGEATEHDGQRYQGLDLAGRDLSGHTFEDCAFSGCNLSGALLARGKFLDCHFSHSNLSLARVAHSRWRAVVFEDCKLVGVNWTSAAWQRLATAAPLEFHRCILNDSSFLGLSLEELVLEHCKLREVDFREANLSRACLVGSEFGMSLFNRTNLAGADFTDATDFDIDVLNNTLKGARFSRHEAVRLLYGLGIELVD